MSDEPSEHVFPRPGISEAEAFGESLGYAVRNGADPDRAFRLAEAAALEIRRQHDAADLFAMLGMAIVVQPRPTFREPPADGG